MRYRPDAPLGNKRPLTMSPRPLALSALLSPGRPLVMGILNVTPDSFSDGGRFFAPERAISHARAMVEGGADILDVGAESTRPYGGAKPVGADEEIARLAPVLEAVVAMGKPVSLDTMKPAVARWGLERGVAMLNDVWGFQRDADIANVAAEFGAPVVLMHNRAEVDGSIDILADIEAFFRRSLALAARAGVAADQILLDPGIGFGKTPSQSIEALAKVGRLRSLGKPLLVGASRKRFIDSVSPAPPERRIGGSLAAALHAVDHGAMILRVHDVAETTQALRVRDAIMRVS